MLMRVLSLVLIVIGFAGLGRALILELIVSNPNSLEMPLADIGDVAISDDNSVFIALPTLGRIQKYSPTGKFVSSIPVDFAGGLFCFNITEERLRVYVARRNAVDELDLSGNPVLLNVALDPGEFDDACTLDTRIVSIDRSMATVKVTTSKTPLPVIIHRQWWHYAGLSTFASVAMFLAGLWLWPEWRQRMARGVRERFAKK